LIVRTVSLPKEISPCGSLDLFLQESPTNKRPLVLICPGGGYENIATREGKPMTAPFLAMGCHGAVLSYSVAPYRYPTQLLELAYCVKFLREKAEEFGIDSEKIVVLGCSAGGHLAANLGTCWQEDWLCEKLSTKKEKVKPNGLILCYPVITAGQYAHKGSFWALLGQNPAKSLLEQVWLEKKVTENTPKTFIWHTFDDDVVPVENALLFVDAMKKANVPCEFHLYPHGEHGLALANEQTAGANGRFIEPRCAGWVDLAKEWMEQL
jgi:acetyl esterase/lipase